MKLRFNKYYIIFSMIEFNKLFVLTGFRINLYNPKVMINYFEIFFELFEIYA